MSELKSELNSEFFTEFLDDYFAECDEHLAVARRNLLALERLLNQSGIDRSLVDELFRSFHSIKGISGMVGLREAEQLAHHMESYLRALRNGQQILSPEGMDALIAGTKLLEHIIRQRRARIPVSDITRVVKQLEEVVSEISPAGSGSVGSDPSPGSTMDQHDIARLDAVENGRRTWRFEFVPEPALAERGINVNVIRARLQEIGQLIHAAPRVMAHGGIAFEFLVSSSAEESAFAAWSDDGLIYKLDETPAGIALTGSDEPEVAPHPASRSRASSQLVRVDLGRLDDLMRMVGELVISRSRLDDQVKHLEPVLDAPAWRPLQETSLAMERQLRDLREGVMRVRMVPIGEIFERMQFVVRDLAREYQKTVKLELRGQQTEIDKFLVERMMDPILHLVRNAVSHGLETASERIASGKRPEGRIALRASAAAEMVVIEIEDDGRGIDADQVATHARATGLINADTELDNAAVLDLICAPGFSTRIEADRASGRGIGMNVVNNTILGLGGSLQLNTEAGRGTRFTIQLPLTLAIADALIVRVGDQRFAVQQTSVLEVMELDSSQVKVLENNDIVLYRGVALPLLRLARLFGIGEKAANTFHAFVIGSALNPVGIAVDRILGHREIVVRAISDPLLQVAGIAGATELGDGRVVLILDPTALARSARKPSSKSR